ncbi:nek protein kinase [Plasmopara halstedii]|uniref:non-specific serine/threonine protein kinase n=1 Tax=Plasmopara halstedii TaxID=4781 RepID=A0A0P1AVD0_PLAHL|nr:nek protein kinase [Plasmopara halstedii]CEG46278.1 nek protein kinase [Plasmopara halstedii]|eukprot:XP_024582647.1 nek protein kinase [Plasmopara halstedii]
MQELPVKSKDIYTQLAHIGHGTYADVFLCMHKTSGDYVCLKEMDVSFLSSDERERCLTEVTILQHLSAHPNIVGFREAFWKESLEESQQVLILVLDYADGGSLAQYLRVTRTTEECAREIFIEIVRGVLHLHSHHIIHRDLKCDNILLFRSGRIVVGDFGTSKQIIPTAGENQVLKKQDLTATVVGSPLYMSPELLEGKLHGFATDIWSLGCVLYELLSGGKPSFGAASYPAVVIRITQGEYDQLDPEVVSKEACDLIDMMLQKEPRKRPSIMEVLRSSWLEKAAISELKSEVAFINEPLSPYSVISADSHQASAKPYDRFTTGSVISTRFPPPAPMGIMKKGASPRVAATRNQKRLIRRSSSIKRKRNLSRSRVVSPLIWLDEEPPPPPVLPFRNPSLVAPSIPFKQHRATDYDSVEK